MQRRWLFPTGDQAAASLLLSRETGLPAALAGRLVRNGCESSESAGEFLDPRLRSLGDPFALPDMDAAVRRTLHAIETGEKIALYGDYDVDGITSLALLSRILSAMGAHPACFLPLRAEEGYGLSPSGVARCFEEHAPHLLIAVDCGTNSSREAETIRSLGADIVILDHHEPSSERPDCLALVNPKFGAGLGYLCSAGIAFKFAHALLKASPHPGIDLKRYLDLAALATIADLVPLVGENRILAHRGLDQMARTDWPGLSALMAVSGVTRPVRGSDVGFRLGPRINASGRLGAATESLRLLLTDDSREATLLAASLDRQNRDRQNVERLLILEVEGWVEAHFDAARDASIVAGHRDWHHGVLGIVASRIMRRHHRPTLLVGFDEGGTGKGSGRSIEGLSLVEALARCADHLDKFGGHDMAAGLTVQAGRFDSFRNAFEESTRELVTDEILTPKLRLDAELPLHEVSLDFLESQERLEPYGTANTQPVYAARGLTPLASPKVLKEKHLRLEFPAGRQRLSAIWFNAASDLPRPPWDMAFTVERNTFNGRTDVQVRIVDVRTAE